MVVRERQLREICHLLDEIIMILEERHQGRGEGFLCDVNEVRARDKDRNRSGRSGCE